eukprot:CAMPEP_0119281410 /NCGR_PEP_ID=MMETSP1329-20130426/24672_1 /TAXON_ID=114041 /ORGANISM="Genus nov. species nov., Strain RCC1024" /LENGTH=73 /DNA_ID=CAMNT_0007282027 /DNA_START=188 /DNA_END=406 /DNA_ORIENTATION=-
MHCLQGLAPALDAPADAAASDSRLSADLEVIRGAADDPLRPLLVALEEAVLERRGGERASSTEIFAAAVAAAE